MRWTVLLALSASLAACSFELTLCPEDDTDTVALYCFDRDERRFPDRVRAGAPDLVREDGVTWATGPGGGALHFPYSKEWRDPMSPATPVYAYLPASPAWRLATGSLDFWLRLEAPPVPDTVQGILSREADGEQHAGHLTMFRWHDENGDWLAVRLQDGNEQTNDASLCSTVVLTPRVWHHLGLNFGDGLPLELFIDGEQSGTDPAAGTRLDYVYCDRDLTGSIEGNDQPWVLGAHSLGAEEGKPSPASAGLGGSIAALRFSRVRRDFSR